MNGRNPMYPNTPLPLRVLPRLWEDLASFLSRTARNMGYERPQWVLQPEHISYRLREEALPYLYRTEDFLYLEQLLRLDEETLYLLTLHRFAPILQRGTEQPVPQKTTLIARALLSDGSSFAEPLYTKVCPTCLDQLDGYDRLHWRAVFIVLCPDHLLLLRTNCPHCKKHIPV